MRLTSLHFSASFFGDINWQQFGFMVWKRGNIKCKCTHRRREFLFFYKQWGPRDSCFLALKCKSHLIDRCNVLTNMKLSKVRNQYLKI